MALISIVVGACGGTVDLGGDGEAGGSSEAGAGATTGSGASGGEGGGGEAGAGGGAAGESASGGSGGSSSGGSGGASSGGSGGASSGGSGGSPAIGNLLETDKLDVLFVVDNSASMADKQGLLSPAVQSFLERIRADHPGVRSIHVGVITSSLGTGADSCTPEGSNFNPTQDDHATFITRRPDGSTAATYEGAGFVAWDPDGAMDPPGDPDLGSVAATVRSIVEGAGERGCGFESQLEAWYRFLFEPDPPERIERVPCFAGDSSNGCTARAGTNQALLAQRMAFLRPDSAVAIVMLTDENDCSTQADGQFFVSLTQQNADGTLFHLPRATDPCLDNPNDPCCHTCGTSAPDGCPPSDTYEQCQIDSGFYGGVNDEDEDSINLRCFEQKRRFGIDFLYPTDRYVRALTSTSLPDRAGNVQPNPVYADLAAGRSRARGRELVFLTGIVGIPWQYVATSGSTASNIDYMSAAELDAARRWPAIAGNPDAHVAPADPMMKESIESRSGETLTGDAMAPPTAGVMANPINGHEWNIVGRDDLQYACIFPLAAPRPMVQECNNVDRQLKPLCQHPDTGEYGTTQYFAKAFPGLRHLAVLRGVGDNAVAASICGITERAGVRGYYPAVDALADALAPRLAR